MTEDAPDSRSVELTNIVNASGFAFQLAVEHKIRRRIEERGGWGGRIVPEHPWRDLETGEKGFIDLIVGTRLHAVIECKRTQDATWIFLQPGRELVATTDIRCRWLQGGRGLGLIAGVDALRATPDSPQAAFCTIRGSGESEKSLLERIAARLIQSVDCLAEEQIGLSREAEDVLCVYIPIIVTTARLVVCTFDPDSVSLDDGMLQGGVYQEVEVVRFRKTLSTRLPEGAPARNLAEVNLAKERTVFVVRSSHILRFLELLDLRESSPWHPYPWVRRRGGQ